MRRFWCLYLWPIWSGTLGCVEAVGYVGRLDEGRERIREARAVVAETGEWPEIDWWTPEPEGLLDYGSWPIVSATRGSGDCDDAMLLAETILVGQETCRAFVSSSTVDHIVLLWKVGSYWYIISNMTCYSTRHTTPEAAAWEIYKEDTTSIIID